MSKLINFTEVNPISNKQNLIIKNQIFSTIKKKDFILGKAVNEFEKEFSKLSKIKYSVGCASGTDALILSLMSLNLKKEDEIIFFENETDLIEKLNYYKINIDKRIKIAKKGQRKYFKLFNEIDIAEYIVKRSTSEKRDYQPAWE